MVMVVSEDLDQLILVWISLEYWFEIVIIVLNSLLLVKIGQYWSRWIEYKKI